MFTLREGTEPVYRRVAEAIKQAIRDGLYQPGDQLPTVRSVAAELLLNPNTVARAYHLLEQEGVIETAVGRGSFVIERLDELEKVKTAIADGFRLLHHMGWTVEELEVWCSGVLRGLTEGRE